MTEVVGKKISCLLMLMMVALFGGCNGQGEQFDQDPLPSRSKFSAQLKEQNIAFPVKVMELPAAPTTRDPSSPTTSTPQPESVTEELSLWEMMKHNFNKGLNLKSEESTKSETSNSVYAPVKSSHLSSSWDWASKLGSSSQNSKLPNAVGLNSIKLNDTGDRSTRDAGWGSHHHQTIAWDTAKIVGNVGRGLLHTWWTKTIVKPNILAWPLILSPLHNLASVVGGGWGKAPGKVVVVHDTSLLERWIRAKFSITQHLLLAKLRLTKALITSTIPGTIKIKLNLVNYLLNIISRKDFGYFLKTLRRLRLALWAEKQRFLWRLLKLKAPTSGYEEIIVIPTSKPLLPYGESPSLPWVSKLPEVHYGDPSPKPDIHYGYPSPKPDIHYGDPSPKPDIHYGDPSPKPEIHYGDPSSKPWVSKPIIHYGDHVSTPSPDYTIQSSSHPWSKGQQDTVITYQPSKPTHHVLKNPLYAFPSYEDSKHESQYAAYANAGLKGTEVVYATLPPVVNTPQSSYALGSGSENVVVSSKFLRDLMRQSHLSKGSKGDEGGDNVGGETHSQPKTRSNQEEETQGAKNYKQNKFSDQLRIHSGFTP